METMAYIAEFRARVAAVDLALPPSFEDLEDAANFVQILWKERAQDRNLIANSILDIIPEPAQWPDDYRRLNGARLLVALAQSEEMPQAAAKLVFAVCANLSEDFDIASCDAKLLFLYLFNLWAVLIARAPDGVTTLAASQEKVFWSNLLPHVDTLARKRSNEEKLNLLALVGLLEFTSTFAAEDLDHRVRNVVTGFDFLLRTAEQRKAVNRFFAFRGLMMIGPARLISDDRALCNRLLDAFKSYDFETPVLNLLRDNLRSGHPFFSKRTTRAPSLPPPLKR